jgi:precorrin-6A/cobalt-precorrin-6A reductase
VTRPEARANLFRELPQVEVEVRGFTDDALTDFLRRNQADVVLDATHPFAVRITRIAHGVCTRLGVPYVRYERPDWQPPDGTHFADSFAEAAETLPSLGRRVLLTIGAKQLKHFAHLHGSAAGEGAASQRVTMFARILPAPVSIQQALDAGFTADRIMCLRPPFSRPFNRALFQNYGIDALVTKASGKEGGVVEKVLAARDLGMAVLMIRRPLLEGITAVSSLDDAVAACCRFLS